MTTTTWKQLATAMALTGAMALSSACDDGEPDEGAAEAERTAEAEGTAQATEVATGGQPETAVSAEVRGQVARALDAYERIRSALVQDSGEVAAAARELSQAATAAAADAPQELRTHLTSVASEAGELAEAPASDLPRLRRDFGELSREVVGLLAAEESLAEGLHVFECGMADGYGKWVQTSEEIDNPYMGTSMPACASPSSLAAI